MTKEQMVKRTAAVRKSAKRSVNAPVVLAILKAVEGISGADPLRFERAVLNLSVHLTESNAKAVVATLAKAKGLAVPATA